MALLNLDFRNMDLGFTFLLTFHYGAIKAWLLSVRILFKVLLTFHYGAIKPEKLFKLLELFI